MKIYHKNKLYKTIYYPFYKTEKDDNIEQYGIRYPSGRLETFYINHPNGLKQYLEMMIEQYLLEDDISLTQHGLEIKQDVRTLFGY